MKFLMVMAVVGGCTGVTRGHVEVVARTEMNVPAAGDLVVFADVDGTSRTATLDDQGHADGEVEAGGSVWWARMTASMLGSNKFTAYTNVQIGDALVFGPDAPAMHAARGTMTIAGALPGTSNRATVVSSCTMQVSGTSPAVQLALDDRCGTTVDVLIVASTATNPNDVIDAYIYLPAQPIVDGGTITLDSGAWKPPEAITIRVQNAPALDQPNQYVFVSNGFGIRTYDARGQGDTITAKLPLVGSLRLGVLVGRAGQVGQPGQFASIALPAIASQDLDMNHVFAPWVTEEPPLAWSMDDAGGVLTANAMVTEYEWSQPFANFSEQMNVRILSAVKAPGDLGLPRLPDALAKYRPGADFQIDASALLMRLEGGDHSNDLRAAELLTFYDSIGGGLALDVSTSVAITMRF